MKRPARPPEPAPEANPLGEWYADIECWKRQPFVVMLNAATGAVLVLGGSAAALRRLHEHALLQFAGLCAQHGLRGPGADAELHGFDASFTCARTRDCSLLASLNQRKFEVSPGFDHKGHSLFDSAALQWVGLFQHPDLGPDPRSNSPYHNPRDLLRQRLACAQAGSDPSDSDS